jgi:hypothetical protein
MPKLLTQGSAGPDVRKLQHALNARPYLHLVEDGIFGPRTESAVIQFQRRVHLVPDGIVGPKTEALLWARVVTANANVGVPLSGSLSPPQQVGPGKTPSPPLKLPLPPPAGVRPPGGAGVVQQVSVGGQVLLAPWLVVPSSGGGAPGPIWSGTVSYTLVYRTASEGAHVEFALNPQFAVNSRVQATDPRFGLQVNGQVTFADLLARDRFHLISPFLQLTASLAATPGISFGSGFAIGNQVSFDLISDRLQITLQGSVAAQWSNMGRPDANFSVGGQGAVGTTVQF